MNARIANNFDKSTKHHYDFLLAWLDEVETQKNRNEKEESETVDEKGQNKCCQRAFLHLDLWSLFAWSWLGHGWEGFVGMIT